MNRSSVGRYYRLRWRILDRLRELPCDVAGWWACRRGRHHVKMDSRGRCYRCGRPAL